MDLILLRHGKAENHHPAGDATRALTSKGHQQAQRQATRLNQAGCLPEIVLCSPLVRARETAETFCQEAGIPGPLIQGWIACGMAPDTALRELMAFTDFNRVAIVGHEPDLSHFVAYTLGIPGNAIRMKKGAMACLSIQPPSARATLKFLIPPKLGIDDI